MFSVWLQAFTKLANSGASSLSCHINFSTALLYTKNRKCSRNCTAYASCCQTAIWTFTVMLSTLSCATFGLQGMLSVCLYPTHPNVVKISNPSQNAWCEKIPSVPVGCNWDTTTPQMFHLCNPHCKNLTKDQHLGIFIWESQWKPFWICILIRKKHYFLVSMQIKRGFQCYFLSGPTKNGPECYRITLQSFSSLSQNYCLILAMFT